MGLQDAGWEPPLDASPVSLPHEWTGGEVQRIGIGSHRRRWKTRFVEDAELLIIEYGSSFDIVYVMKYANYEGGFFPSEEYLPAVPMHDDATDSDCATVAQSLMQRISDTQRDAES